MESQTVLEHNTHRVHYSGSLFLHDRVVQTSGHKVIKLEKGKSIL